MYPTTAHKPIRPDDDGLRASETTTLLPAAPRRMDRNHLIDPSFRTWKSERSTRKFKLHRRFSRALTVYLPPSSTRPYLPTTRPRDSLELLHDQRATPTPAQNLPSPPYAEKDLSALALATLRVLLPLPAFPAQVAVHDLRDSPFAARRAVHAPVVLAPWLGVEGVKGVVLGLCGMELAAGVGGEEVELERAVGMPLVHSPVARTDRGRVRLGWSVGFAEEERAGGLTPVVEGTLYPILSSLARGQGVLVLRLFLYDPDREPRHPKEAREALLQAHDARVRERRDCEAMTAAGSPVSGGMVPGSPGSAGSAGSASLDGSAWALGEPAVCGRCV